MNEAYNPVLTQYPNIKLLYFLGEEKTDLIGDQYIHLPGVKNDYLSASYKQFLGLKYIYEHYQPKFIMSIGTDTYVNIKKLNLFLTQYDPNESLYIGGHGDIRDLGICKVFFHSGGPGFILSKTCLHYIYNQLDTFMDTWIALCKTYKLDLVPACDVGIAYLIQMLGANNIFTKTVNTGNYMFTHCNHRGYPCHVGKINMSQLISCHNMSLRDFDDFTHILNTHQYFI
ncbi:MAG: hypothetical protein ACOVRN_07465 [Flavobacterium sp.]